MVRPAASILVALHIYAACPRANIPPSSLPLPSDYENYNMSHLYRVTDQQTTCLLQRYVTHSIDIAYGGLPPTITFLGVFPPTLNQFAGHNLFSPDLFCHSCRMYTPRGLVEWKKEGDGVRSGCLARRTRREPIAQRANGSGEDGGHDVNAQSMVLSSSSPRSRGPNFSPSLHHGCRARRLFPTHR